MPRPKKLIKSSEFHVILPATLALRITALLYSEAKGRIPQGALSLFFERAAEAELERIDEELARGAAALLTHKELTS